MSKIYINTRVDKIGRGEAVRIANMAVRWCRRHMGINKRKKYSPVWTVCKSYEGDDDTHGEYDPEDNEIYIYWNNCNTVSEIIGTAIHEWTHQLQPVLKHYNKYKDYNSNPYELEARHNETLYTPICWNTIKQKINRV